MEDDVVISGISGRFPECDNLEDFWENLVNGIDMVTENDRRWPIGLHGLPARTGTLKVNLEKFDSRFFNISQKQAEKLDPQSAQLLEITFEAVLDAGVNPQRLRGTNVGVFTGCSSQDVVELARAQPETISPFDLLGGTACMLSNRISYSMDLKGPSYILDTYCSSSMVALHNAAAAIRNGECEAALVCGVNLLLNPLLSLQINCIGVLSSDGKCKSFDASGNGYARSEAVVAVFLQKKSVARRIYATIVHSKSSADGYKSSGISHPSGTAQQKLMEETYAEAGVSPSDVFFVELHGTGTAAGDPMELNAIGHLFAGHKTKESPLLIGATKSNMGHAEAASSLCALSKMVLSLQNGLIPPNLHFSQPNRAAPALLNGMLKIVTECTPIKGRLFSMNAAGIGGSNAHIILKSDDTKGSEDNCRIPILVPFSGRTLEGVNFALKRIATSEYNGTVELLQKIHEDSIPGFDCRGFMIVDEFKKYKIFEAQVVEENRPLWFSFAGMGSQWVGMAKEMMAFPVFKTSIEMSAEILTEFELDLNDILIERSEVLMSKHIGISYISVGMALIDLMSSLGLHPDGMFGHSAGEHLCGYADGCLSRREALLVSIYKDEVIQLCSEGGMAAVGLTWEETEKQCPPGIYPACHNGHSSVTVCGPSQKIKDFVQQMNAQGTFVREVDTGGIAFHSPYLAPIIPSFRAKLSALLLNPKKRSEKWISTSLPESRWNEPIAETASAEYFVNNSLSPVLYYEALKHVPHNAVVVEVSSHALFQSILKKDLPKTCSIVGLMQKNAEDIQSRFVAGIGSLYQLGFNPKITKLYPEHVFPVRTGSPMIAPLIQWNHEESFPLPNFNRNLSGNSRQAVEITLANKDDKFLEGHTIDNRVLFPATAYLVLAWKAFAKLHGTDFQNLPVSFENVKFERATILPNTDATIKFQVSILEISGQFEISEGASIIASGTIFKSDGLSTTKFLAESDAKIVKLLQSLDQEDIYKWFRLRGYQYSGLFQGIISADIGGTFCKLNWFDNWIAFLDTMLQTSLFSSNPGTLCLPTGLSRLSIDPVMFRDFMDNNKTTELPVESSVVRKTISAPGIRLEGLTFTQSPRKGKIQPAAILEEYRFVPYLDSQDANWEITTAMKVCLDIILENITKKVLSVCEFAEQGETNIVATEFQNLNNQPGRKIDVDILLEEDVVEATSKSSTNGMQNQTKYDLLIVRENPGLISKYGFLVQSVGFVIFVTINPSPAELIQEIKESCWNPIPVVYKKTCDLQIYVLRKVPTAPQEILEVDVDLDYNWLGTVRAALTNTEKSVPTILLHSNSPNCGLIGLVNCLRAEPGGGNIICASSPTTKLPPKFPDNNLAFSVFNDKNELGSYRHVLIPNLQPLAANGILSKNVCLRQTTRGNLSTIRWFETATMDKQDRTVYSVNYAPLNFRDIMVATGQLSPDALPLVVREENNVFGTEFVGTDSEGQRVMGVVPCKGFATQIRASKGLFWPVPKNWTMEEAATVPVAYSTAYYALVIRGQIQKGESILIHSGAGAVGQAAIAVALSKQCTVYTTVGSEQKKKFLMERFPELEERNFASSRNTEFKQHILNETLGQGVNLVLNSLAEGKLQASLDILANDGRFLEIGKFDLFKDSKLGMAVFLKNISFHGILLENYAFSTSVESTQRLVNLVQEGIEMGTVQPLQRTIYSYDQAEDAFRFMASGKHIGKIILKIRDEAESSPSQNPLFAAIPFTSFDPKKIYVIVGGLGGVGLEMADWFMSRGARKLALVSRSGIVNGFQELKKIKWIEAGARVLILKHDASTLEGTKELFKECLNQGPIGGIFNLAMVLRDGLFVNQTVEDFDAVLKPKLNITSHLDFVSRELCLEDLEYFVVFSSVSCGRGNAGQSNYGMANSSMERICENRRKDGLPALAIQWGAIAEVGVAHEKTNGKDVLVGGTVPQSLSSCFEAFDKFLYFQNDFKSPIVSSFVLPEKSSGEEAGSDAKNQTKSLCEKVAHILGLKDTSKIPKNITLGELGVDSLVSVEVQQLLAKHSTINLSTNEVRVLTWEKLEAI